MLRRLASLLIMSGFLISLSACSSTVIINKSSSGSSVTKPAATSTKTTVHDIEFKDKISVEQDTKLKLIDYCTSDGKKDTSLVIVPSTVDTSKVGKQSIDVTITDENGIIYLQTVEVTVTAKPEPKADEKKDDTPQESTTDNQQSEQNTYVPDTQPSSGTTYTPPETVQPSTPATQPETPSYTPPSQDAPDNDVIATKPSTSDGAPAGSTYDNINSCDAAASKTKSHACTWSSSANAWVLTY